MSDKRKDYRNASRKREHDKKHTRVGHDHGKRPRASKVNYYEDARTYDGDVRF